MNQREPAGNVHSVSACATVQGWRLQVAKFPKDSPVPPWRGRISNALLKLSLLPISTVEELERKYRATKSSVCSDLAGWRAESPLTLQGLRMQRNIPNGCTEPKSHQWQGSSLKDFSSESGWLTHKRRNKWAWRENTTKFSRSKACRLRLPTATEPSVPPLSSKWGTKTRIYTIIFQPSSSSATRRTWTDPRQIGKEVNEIPPTPFLDKQ